MRTAWIVMCLLCMSVFVGTGCSGKGVQEPDKEKFKAIEKDKSNKNKVEELKPGS